MSDHENNEQNNGENAENRDLNNVEEQLTKEILDHFSSLNLESKEETINEITKWAQNFLSNRNNFLKQIHDFHNIYVDCLNSQILEYSLEINNWQKKLNLLLSDNNDNEKFGSQEEKQKNISDQINELQQQIKETKERIDEIVVKETKANEEFKSVVNKSLNSNSKLDELDPLIRSQQSLYEELQARITQNIPKELQFIGSQPIEDKSKLEFTTKKGDMDPIIEESKKENSQRLEEILQKTKQLTLAYESFDPIIIESTISPCLNNNNNNNNNAREKKDLTLIIAPLFTIDQSTNNTNQQQNNNNEEEEGPVVTLEIKETNEENDDTEREPVVYSNSATASSRSLKTSPIHTCASRTVKPFQYQFYREEFDVLPMRVRKSLDLSSKIVQKGIMPEIRKRLIKESLEYFDTNYPNPNLDLGQTILKDEFPDEYGQSFSARSTYGNNRAFSKSLPPPIKAPSSPRSSPQSPRGTLTKREILDPSFNSKEIREEIERIRSIRVPHSTPPKMEGPNDDPAAKFRKFNEEYAAMLDEKSWRKRLGISQPLTPPTRATFVKNRRESRRIHKPSSPSPRPMGVFFDYRQSQMFQPRIAPE